MQKSSASQSDGAHGSSEVGRSELSLDPNHASGSGRPNDSPQPDGEAAQKTLEAEVEKQAVTAAIAAAQEVAREAEAKATEASKVLHKEHQENMAAMTEKISSLASTIASLSEAPARADRADPGVTEGGRERYESSKAETATTQLPTEPQQVSDAITRLLDRMGEVEISLAKIVADHSVYPGAQELQGAVQAVQAVPQLEALVSSLQQAIAGMAEHARKPSVTQPPSAGTDGTETGKVVDAGKKEETEETLPETQAALTQVQTEQAAVGEVPESGVVDRATGLHQPLEAQTSKMCCCLPCLLF